MNKYWILGIFFLSVGFSVLNIYSTNFTKIIPYGDEWMLFLSGISLGLISAIIFYYFQNYLPEKKRKNIVKNNFSESYRYFKLNTIQIFLWLLNEEYDNHEDLLDIKKFREYFDSKWQKIITQIELEDNEEHFNDLLFELDLLHKKINVLTLSLNLSNETLKFFSRLDEVLYRLQYIKRDSDRYMNDSYKYFWGTLWTMFTAWSFITGYDDVDFVEKNLKSI